MKTLENNGTILVKVVGAMLALMVAALGLTPMMVLSIDSDSLADELNEANKLAQDRVEELRANRIFPTLPYHRYEQGVEDKYFITSKVDAEESDPLIPDGVYRINVKVNWVDHNNLSRMVDYKTFTVKEIEKNEQP
jgi:hypothetical protein